MSEPCRHHREYGFVRRYVVTHDGGQLGQVLDRESTAASVWADSAYRSKANLVLLARRGLRAEFQHKKPRRKATPPNIARGNATRASIRSHIEHVFAAQKHRLGLVTRTIGIRARAKIALANLAYNFTRLAWHHRRTTPA